MDRRFGRRVRARRLELEMSQETLAQALGITFQQVQKYERGVNRISASRLYDIAIALDVPITTLFDELTARGEHNETRIFERSRHSADAAALIRLFSAIKDRRVRTRVVRVVRAMTGAET